MGAREKRKRRRRALEQLRLCPNCGAPLLARRLVCSVPCNIFSGWYMKDQEAFEERAGVFKTPARVNGGCERCGRHAGDKRSLDAHHLRYSRWGSEPDADLVLVCRECHGEIHEHLRRNGVIHPCFAHAGAHPRSAVVRELLKAQGLYQPPNWANGESPPF